MMDMFSGMRLPRVVERSAVNRSVDGSVRQGGGPKVCKY